MGHLTDAQNFPQHSQEIVKTHATGLFSQQRPETGTSVRSHHCPGEGLYKAAGQNRLQRRARAGAMPCRTNWRRLAGATTCASQCGQIRPLQSLLALQLTAQPVMRLHAAPCMHAAQHLSLCRILHSFAYAHADILMDLQLTAFSWHLLVCNTQPSPLPLCMHECQSGMQETSCQSWGPHLAVGLHGVLRDRQRRLHQLLGLVLHQPAQACARGERPLTEHLEQACRA